MDKICQCKIIWQRPRRHFFYADIQAFSVFFILCFNSRLGQDKVGRFLIHKILGFCICNFMNDAVAHGNGYVCVGEREREVREPYIYIYIND